jgi:hypothetical protein
MGAAKFKGSRLIEIITGVERRRVRAWRKSLGLWPRLKSAVPVSPRFSTYEISAVCSGSGEACFAAVF